MGMVPSKDCLRGTDAGRPQMERTKEYCRMVPNKDRICKQAFSSDGRSRARLRRNAQSLRFDVRGKRTWLALP